MKTFYTSLLAAMVLFIGCSKDDSDDVVSTPSHYTLTIQFDHLFEGASFAPNAEYTDQVGNTMTVSKFKYLLSNLYLTNSSGAKVALDTFAFVDAVENRISFEVKNVLEGNYTGFEFMIGLDEAVNGSNPNLYASNHPLSPIVNNMHWDWTSGYIFHSIEGTYLNNSSQMVPYVFHIAANENKKVYSFDQMSLNLKEDKTIVFSFDIAEMFVDPENYLIKDKGDFSHSTNDGGIANTLVNNTASAIRFQSIQ